MKDTIAFEIQKTLKQQGFKVSVDDAPAGRPPMVDKTCLDLAVIGSKDMSPEDVKTCADTCRRLIRRACEPYTLDTTGHSKHYPDASFAAW